MEVQVSQRFEIDLETEIEFTWRLPGPELDNKCFIYLLICDNSREVYYVKHKCFVDVSDHKYLSFNVAFCTLVKHVTNM